MEGGEEEEPTVLTLASDGEHVGLCMASAAALVSFWLFKLGLRRRSTACCSVLR